MSERGEVLIDAYNVMFAHPRIGPLVRRDLQEAREEFLALVSRNRSLDSTRVVIVYDAHRDPGVIAETGRQGSAYARGIHVVFARETADVWIQRRIREHSDPARLTIVTSDREILSTARAHGAQKLSVAEFLGLPSRRRARAERTARSEKPEHLSKREIEAWERLFEKRREED
ncbi:MAG: NYN domain-containing protein [Candidatus Krumholzibacteriia bacterium]